MELEEYEQLKREAAAKVDEWFQQDPEHWQEKAREAIAACLENPSPLDDIRGTLDVRKNTIAMPTFADHARAMRVYYLGLVILHDSADAGYEAIAADLWPTGGIPVANAKGKQLKRESKAQVSLWHAARTVFHSAWGDKSDCITAALHAVEKDLNPERKPLGKTAQTVYEMLVELPEHQAMTGPEILDRLAELDPPVYIGEDTFKDVRKELIPYGIRNRPRVGYYIRKTV